MSLRSPRLLQGRFGGGASALLLALLLALGQQHALLHWLSHAVSAVAAAAASAETPDVGASVAPDIVCDECLALVAFNASSPASSWAFDGIRSAEAPTAAPAQPGVATALRLAFRSRAPPILS